MPKKQTRSHWFDGTVLHVDKAGIVSRASVDKLRGLSATDVCVHNEAGIDMPPALLVYLGEVLSGIKGGAVADWSDDEEPTGSGPVYVIPPEAYTVENIMAGMAKASEADEEPTLLGPNPTIAEDDGEVPPQPVVVDVRTHCGVPVPGNSAPEGDWKAFHEAVEANLLKQRLVDEVAIQLYTKGFPQEGLYAKAEKFWALREAYLQRKR